VSLVYIVRIDEGIMLDQGSRAVFEAIQFTSAARCQILWALYSSDYDDSEGSNLFREIKYLLEINFAD
jgi:hypothetical protein